MTADTTLLCRPSGKCSTLEERIPEQAHLWKWCPRKDSEFWLSCSNMDTSQRCSRESAGPLQVETGPEPGPLESIHLGVATALALSPSLTPPPWCLLHLQFLM